MGSIVPKLRESGLRSIAISINGSDWTKHSGESFTRSITLSALGEQTIQVSARNTEFDTDPGTDNKSVVFTVNVIESGLPTPLGELTVDPTLPNEVNVYEDIVISGNCPNADHIDAFYDEVLVNRHLGESFTETIATGGIGLKGLKIIACNTENDTDPGSDSASYEIKTFVTNTTFRIVRLTSNSVTVEVDSPTNKTVKLLDVVTNEVLPKPAGDEVEFNSIGANKKYRIMLWNSNDIEEAGENFITGVGNINITSVTKNQITIQQY